MMNKDYASNNNNNFSGDEASLHPSWGSDDENAGGLEIRLSEKGRYQIIRQLSSGGMSRIYLGKDKKMDSDVVIKEMTIPQGEERQLDYFKKRFQEEARLLFRLSCRGIPKVTDFFSDGDSNYLVMEHVKGKDLRSIPGERNEGRISIDEFINWMDQLLETLAFLHNQKPPIIHRDIKPANIMLTPDERLILVDFGLAKPVEKEIATQTYIGTKGYASPEHYLGRPAIESDIYSLGASFHFLLTGEEPSGRLPFDFPPLSDYQGDSNPILEYILDKMLKKKIEERYYCIEQIQKDLNVLKEFQQDPLKFRNFSLDKMPSYNILVTGPVTNILSVDDPIGNIVRAQPDSPRAGNVTAFMQSDEEDEKEDNQQKKFIMPVVIFASLLIISAVLLFSMKWFGNEPKGSSPESSPVSSGISAVDSPAPDNLDSDILKGEQLLSSGNYESAKKVFSAVLNKDPDSIPSMVGRGRAKWSLKDPEAIDDFSRALEIQPQNLEALWYRSEIYTQRGDFNNAINDLNELLKVKPDSPHAQYNRARAYRKLGKTAEAIKDLESLQNMPDTDDNPIDEEEIGRILGLLYTEKGRKHFESKEYPEAIKTLERSLKYNPNDGEILFLLCSSNQALGNINRAMEYCKKAYETDPKSEKIRTKMAGFYYMKAKSKIKSGDSVDAVKDLETSLTYSPDNNQVKSDMADLCHKLGVRYYSDNNLELAKKYLDRSILLSSNNAEAYFYRGFVNYNLGNRPLAIHDFEMGKRLSPDSVYVSRIPEDLRFGGVRPTPREEPLEKGDKFFYISRAEIELKNRNFILADRYATEALKLDRNIPEGNLFKAEANYQLRRYSVAFTHFNIVKRVSPPASSNYLFAERRLGELRGKL